MATVSEIARSPRPPGSAEHERVQALLATRLREAGFEVELQASTQVRARGETAVAVTVRNVAARRPGTGSTGTLLLSAHYDSRASSPGAGDDATGVAVLLETVRALQGALPLENDVVVLLTDGEEYGLHGARAFVEGHPWMDDVRVVLNLEMRGAGGPSLMFQTGAENGWVVEQLVQADPSPVANSLFVEVYRRLPNDTDFSAFLDAGVQGLNFAAIGRSERYHQSTDTPENLQETTVQHHGLRILALVRHLGEQDLSVVDAPDRSFVPVPILGLVTLPRVWAWPLTLGVLGGILLVTFVATLRGARSRGIVLGSLLSLLTVGASAAAGWLLFRWVAPFHEEFGALTPAFYGEGLYRWALGSIGFVLTVGLFEAARPWVRPLEASLVALLLPALALAAMTLTAPAAALNLQIPLAAIVVLLLGLAVTGLHRSRGHVAWAATLVVTLPVLVFLTPLVDLLTVALGMGAAPVLGGLIALVLLILVPALEWLDTPNRWWAPLIGLAASAGMAGVGIARAEPGPDRPIPSTLLHTLTRDGEGVPRWARWVTLAEPAEGLAWARDRVGGDFAPDSAGLLDGFLLPDRSWLIREAPIPAIAPPRIVVLRDVVVAGERRVRLGILSRAGAESLTVTAPDGVSFQGVAGTPEDAADLEALGPAVRTVVHWGRTEPDLTVAFAGPAGLPWEISVIEGFHRPGTLLTDAMFERPAHLMANSAVGGDRMLVRTPYTVGEDVLSGPVDPALGPRPDSGGTTLPDTLPATVDSTGIGDAGSPTDPASVPDTLARPDSTTLPDSTAARDSATARDSLTLPDSAELPESTARPDTTLRPDSSVRRQRPTG
jgi:hypothetical protein